MLQFPKEMKIQVQRCKLGTSSLTNLITPIVYLSTDSTISTKAVILHKVTDQKAHLDNLSHKYTFLLIFVKKISWTKIAETL